MSSPDLRTLVAAALFSAAAVNRRKKAAVEAPKVDGQEPAPQPEITPFADLEASAKLPYITAASRLGKILRWNVQNRDKVAFDLHTAIQKQFGSVPFDARAMVETYFNFQAIFKAS